MSALPPTWVDAKLGDVITGFETGRNFQASGSPARDDEVGVLKISSVTWGRFQPNQNKALLPGDTPLPHERVRAGDLLISRANTTELVGAPVLVEKSYPNLMLPDKILRVLYDSQLVDARFLLYALRSRSARMHLQAQATGTSDSMRNLSQPKLRETPIPLAPLAEQQRIAAKLETLLARVDACRERLARLPVIVKRFRQAVLQAAMSGALTADWRSAKDSTEEGTRLAELLAERHEAAGGHRVGNAASPTEGAHDLAIESLPSGWGLTTLRDAVEPNRPITYGILKPGPDISDGVPYIRVADFPNERLELSGIRRTSSAMDAEFKRSRLRTGDLLLSIRGTVGRVIMVPKELEAANITQDSARLSVQPVMNISFVLSYLRSEPAQSRMRRAIKGVAVRGINIGDVRALQLPVPSREEQDEIVRRIESLFSVVDALGVRLTSARTQVDRITPALLEKAFHGELVPQDSSDEPTGALLKRIASAKRSPLANSKSAYSPRRSKLKPASKLTLPDIIQRMPEAEFTFEELRQMFAGDYESLKDELFALLTDKHSGVEQYFDVSLKTMKLRRIGK